MQDFYILQRTPTALNSEQAKKWFYTIEMLGPEGIMSGDDDILVTYTDNGGAAGTIEITSTLTQGSVFGLQTKYELQGGGTASNNGQIKLNIDSNGIPRTETITVTGLNGINIDGSGLKQITSGDWDDVEPTYLPDGGIALLENVRFYEGEESNDSDFSKSLET